MNTTLEQQLNKLNYYKVRYLCRNHVIDASPEDQNWHKDYIIDFILRKYGNMEPNNSKFFKDLDSLLAGKTLNDLWNEFDEQRKMQQEKEEQQRLAGKTVQDFYEEHKEQERLKKQNTILT